MSSFKGRLFKLKVVVFHFDIFILNSSDAIIRMHRILIALSALFEPNSRNIANRIIIKLHMYVKCLYGEYCKCLYLKIVNSYYICEAAVSVVPTTFWGFLSCFMCSYLCLHNSKCAFDCFIHYAKWQKAKCDYNADWTKVISEC